MGATRNFDEIGATTQTMVKVSQDSATAMWDYVVRAQDLNTTLTRRAFEAWLEGLRLQTQLSQDVVQELFERAEEQADALQRLYGQWATMFSGFPFSAFPYPGGTAHGSLPVQRQGMRLVEAVSAPTATGGQAGFPIENYDGLSVDEVVRQLGGLSAEELDQVHVYERLNKNRETLIHEIERKMSFPIEGYDDLNVDEVSGRLDGLSVDELRTIRDYERRNKDRGTLLQEIERKIEAAS